MLLAKHAAQYTATLAHRFAYHHDFAVERWWLCIWAHNPLIHIAVLQVFEALGVTNQCDDYQRPALNDQLTQALHCWGTAMFCEQRVC